GVAKRVPHTHYRCSRPLEGAPGAPTRKACAAVNVARASRTSAAMSLEPLGALITVERDPVQQRDVVDDRHHALTRIDHDGAAQALRGHEGGGVEDRRS